MEKHTSRLTTCIERAKKQGKYALIPFVTAGIPSKEAFWTTVEELALNGADIIEIGVPFSDPVADGAIVAKASEQALAEGINLEFILNGLEKRRSEFPDVGIVLMGYANPFLQYAWQHKKRGEDSQKALENINNQAQKSLNGLAVALAKAGVDGLIIPDLPLNEQEMWRSSLGEKNIAIIPLVGLNTPKERMEEYAKDALGFVYLVSVLGITGGRQGYTEKLEMMMERARTSFVLPLALGFGLQTPDQLAGVPKACLPDAVVFGSALIHHLLSGKTAKAFMEPWTTSQK